MRRTGRQESELLDTTCEGGELIPGGPTGGKREAGSWSRDGKHERDPISNSVSTKLKRIAEPARKLTGKPSSVVLEADIRSLFDKMVHRHLRSFLDGRGRDGAIRRLDRTLSVANP